MALIWSDEFDAPAGHAPTTARWGQELGGGGWGEQQLQVYTDRPANAHVTDDGMLAITARVEPDGSTGYPPGTITSARLVTKQRFSFTHGRVEARIRVPAGPGVWPAFWMLGADIDVVGWPQCGEIDVMEHVGSSPRSVYGTAHGPGFAGARGGLAAEHELPEAVADDFHVFAVDWAPGLIRWSVDDRCYHRLTPGDTPAGGWVFEHDFYLVLNLAVGGSWPGDADALAALPATLFVDHVRVHSLR
jgi:beta-glucanase (GH16 family)